jgi:hypothetical protein
MSLGSILGVIIFVVIGCIAFFTGIKALRQEWQAGNEIAWYKQAYVDMGFTCLFLAVFFLLIGIHDLVPQQNSGLRVFIYVAAGIVLMGAGISCVYMIRYYLSSLQRRT